MGICPVYDRVGINRSALKCPSDEDSRETERHSLRSHRRRTARPAGTWHGPRLIAVGARPGGAKLGIPTFVTGRAATSAAQNPLIDRDPAPVVKAVADLPNEHLWALGDSIKAMPASLALAWLADLILWERRRRFGEVPGDLPEPSISPDQIPVALPLLHIFARPFRAGTRTQEVQPVIRLFEAVTAYLEAALRRGGARMQ